MNDRDINKRKIDEREMRIRLWFDMWLQQRDLGMEDIFAADVVYIESWGPRYDSLPAVKHWYEEWNSRGQVVVWDIKQFFHKAAQTIVEWNFKNEMQNGKIEEFDGVSLIEWTDENKIKFLKEFGCNLNNYDPYQAGDLPKFKDEKINWF